MTTARRGDGVPPPGRSLPAPCRTDGSAGPQAGRREPPASIAITLDGAAVEVPEGSTLLDACRRSGADVPTLCHSDTLTAPPLGAAPPDPIPDGELAPARPGLPDRRALRPAANACRVCVVELEGSRALVPACSRRAEPGMVVHTASDRARFSRRLVLELLASSVDLSTTPEVAGWLDEYGADPARFGPPGEAAATVAQPVKVDNDLYVRAYGRCILCYRCVDACGDQWQNTFAIGVAGRGFAARISTEWDVALPDSACVYCGNCIEVCPTGALAFKVEHDMRADGSWDESRQTETDTICPYCGVGCTLRLRVQDNRIVRVGSPHDQPVTSGNLCIKGRFGHGHVRG